MDQKSSKKNVAIHATYIIIIAVLLISAGGGFYYFNKKLSTTNSQVKAAETKRFSGRPGAMMGMSMAALTPPPVSDQQQQQLTEGTKTDITNKTFNITAGNYYFVPNKITVNKGDTITFVVTNAGGVHDLVIDELGVKTPVTKTATAATFRFIASKAGSFVYYCSLPGHRAKGMWGTLTVE